MEPMTMLTDFILSAVTLFLGGRLVQQARLLGRASLWFWSGVFIAGSAAALAGGILHGLSPYFGEGTTAFLWKIAVYAVGLAGLLMLAGSIMDGVSHPLRPWLLALALVKFFVYCLWMISHNDFLYVICDYGGSMIGVLALQLYRMTRGADKEASFLISGVLVSFAAAGIQQSRISGFLNHNDLYHLVQTGAFYLFYRGLRR